MATTPTDHPLANSERTVGVHSYVHYNISEVLKREALVFDQIAISGLGEPPPIGLFPELELLPYYSTLNTSTVRSSTGFGTVA
jgi:hypothetical protein